MGQGRDRLGLMFLQLRGMTIVRWRPSDRTADSDIAARLESNNNARWGSGFGTVAEPRFMQRMASLRFEEYRLPWISGAINTTSFIKRS